MMREILFRGKRIDNDEWEFGSFCMDAIEQINGGIGFLPVDGFIRLYDIATGKMQMHEVDRETVGQFTGLADKNGKKIFEGDIVRSDDPDYPERKMDCGVGQVEFYAGLWYVSGEVHNSLYDLSTISCKELEVIGNIHDNPEEGGRKWQMK